MSLISTIHSDICVKIHRENVEAVSLTYTIDPCKLTIYFCAEIIKCTKRIRRYCTAKHSQEEKQMKPELVVTMKISSDL